MTILQQLNFILHFKRFLMNIIGAHLEALASSPVDAKDDGGDGNGIAKDQQVAYHKSNEDTK